MMTFTLLSSSNSFACLFVLILAIWTATIITTATEAKYKTPLHINHKQLIKGKEVCREPGNREIQLEIKNTTGILVDCWRIKLAKKSLKEVIDHCSQEESLCDCASTFGFTSALLLTKKETKRSLAGFRQPKKNRKNRKLLGDEVGKPSTRNLATFPKEFNFETNSPLGFWPIQNQGKCPTCWAFSLIAAIEGNVRTNSKKLIKVSEQALVSCFAGCWEWNSIDAYEKYELVGYLPFNDIHPYESFGPGKVPRCNRWFVNETEQAVRVDNPWHRELTDDESIMEHIMTVGPVIVSVYSSTPCFKAYQSGVLTPENCKCDGVPDHAVVFVGWGEHKGIPYWLIRNSWGAAMGDNGYWRIKRGGPGKGMCGYRDFALAINGSVAYH